MHTVTDLFPKVCVVGTEKGESCDVSMEFSPLLCFVLFRCVMNHYENLLTLLHLLFAAEEKTGDIY